MIEKGFNYGMPAINAALGLAQLEKLDKFVNSKENSIKNIKLDLNIFTS